MTFQISTGPLVLLLLAKASVFPPLVPFCGLVEAWNVLFDKAMTYTTVNHVRQSCVLPQPTSEDAQNALTACVCSKLKQLFSKEK